MDNKPVPFPEPPDPEILISEIPWAKMIEQEMSRPKHIVTAEIFLSRYKSGNRPCVYACDDNEEYCVKSLPRQGHLYDRNPDKRMARMMVTEQIVGVLGEAMGAPVAHTCLVNVPKELLDLDEVAAYTDHVRPGIAHASRIIKGCGDRRDVEYIENGSNRARLATLAIFYGWLQYGDPQLIYQNVEPHKVYSVDHGWFFPRGRFWTEETLKSAVPPALCGWIDEKCNFSHKEIGTAVQLLHNVTDAVIVAAVAAPPDEWGITLSERVALAAFLSSRRDDLLSRSIDKIQ